MTVLAQRVKDAADEVFKELGSGHSEAVYETALEVEMRLRNWRGPIMRQVPCPIQYKGHTVGVGYIDILVCGALILELKAVSKLSGRDETQVMKYLLGTGLKNGLLVNFNQVSGEVEVVEVSVPGVPNEGIAVTSDPSWTVAIGPASTTTVTNTITLGSGWDPPDPSGVGAVPSPLLPNLPGGQTLDLPHESSEIT